MPPAVYWMRAPNDQRLATASLALTNMGAGRGAPESP